MIQCPEFDYDFEKTHAVYLWCLHVFSLINLIVNPLIIYCIVYRSTNHMATYRWYLLLHQLAAFVADLWINFFSQGVILVPFPAGYVLGYAKYFMSPIAAFAWGQILVVFEQLTVLLLFFYRYQVVHNAKTISPRWKGIVAFGVTVWAANIYFPLTVRMRSEETFKRLAIEYSCITPRLQQIERIEALDKTDASFNILGLIIFDAIGFVFFMTFFAIGSWKATQTQNMSPKLRQMQQRFIFQLCLQSLVPFAVVVGPMVVLVMAMLCDIFGFVWINDVVFCSASLFSVISAAILFLMNPTYHRWLTKHFTRGKITLHNISSVHK